MVEDYQLPKALMHISGKNNNKLLHKLNNIFLLFKS